MKAYVVLAASLLIQICLGGLFAWSVFVPPLRAAYGLSAAQTQMVFGVTTATFSIMLIVAGRLQARIGPRFVACIGGVLFGLGYLIAGCCGGSWPLLILGIGVVGGMGLGFGYVCPLATCVQWFPHIQGFITGLSVAGFGAGAILLSAFATALLGAGLDVAETFRIVGIVYGSIVFLAALFLSVPAGGCVIGSPSAEMSMRDLLTHRPFWRLVVGMFCGTFAGLLVVGNIKSIALDAGVESSYATISIGTFAIGNAAGRITWGHLSDRIGAVVIPLSLVSLSLAVLALLPASAAPVAFLMVTVLVGFSFGGNLVIYVARVAATFGIAAVGTVYPLVFQSYGLSGVTGPVIGGWLFDRTGSYTASMLVAAAVAALGVIGTTILSPRRPREIA